MKVRSLKTNFILNSIRVFSGALIGIATMPYVNNVLGPINVGKVEFINTIINYFILFSALGIPMYGVREIAKVRENTIERSKLTLELLSILIVTTAISYLLIFGVLINLSLFADYKSLIILMSAMVLFSNVGAEWYFIGAENQWYITMRFLLIRVATLILLFILVRDADDYLWYALIIVLNVCGSNIFNFIYITKSIKKIPFRLLNFRKHLKPIFTIFAGTIAINLYLQLDILLIGVISGDRYVGYYSVANKLIRFVITFITVIGAVLLPRMSRLFNNDIEQYNIYLKKGLDIILILSLFFSILFFFHAEWIINVMAGPEFSESILTMKILSPLCVVVGLAYFVGFLILYTQNQEKIYTKAVVISAIFSVSVNYFAITKFQQNGAAVTALFSELIGISIMSILYMKQIKKHLFVDANELKILMAACIIFTLNFFMSNFIFTDKTSINSIIIITSSLSVYIIFLYLVNEEIIKSTLDNYKRIFK